MPRAAAAAFAPFSRASVAPSPDVPPIWIYIVSPLPSGSSASAGAASAIKAIPPRRILIVLIGFLALQSFLPYLRPIAADSVLLMGSPAPEERADKPREQAAA